MDIDQVAAEMLANAKDALADGWDTLDTFRKSQLRKIARQGALISQMRISGELKDDPEMLDWFAEQLEDKVRNFARAVANITVLTLQKAWNAVVGAIWGAINGILTGNGFAALPIPSLGTVAD